MYICDWNPQDLEAGASKVQGHPHLHMSLRPAWVWDPISFREQTNNFKPLRTELFRMLKSHINSYGLVVTTLILYSLDTIYKTLNISFTKIYYFICILSK